MEYREHVVTKPYQPRFGYLHDPKTEEELPPKGNTMPRPVGEPLVPLLVTILLLLAFLIGALIASRLEYRYAVSNPSSGCQSAFVSSDEDFSPENI